MSRRFTRSRRICPIWRTNRLPHPISWNVAGWISTFRKTGPASPRWSGFMAEVSPEAIEVLPSGLKNQGIAVVAVNYRLHPKVTCPAYLQDAAAAVAWTFRNIEKYGGDADKIFVSGHSAGGYLTSMVGIDKRWLAEYEVDADRIAGLIPLSGHTITHMTVRKEMGIPKTQPLVDSFAPLYHVRPDAPPILLDHRRPRDGDARPLRRKRLLHADAQGGRPQRRHPVRASGLRSRHGRAGHCADADDGCGKREVIKGSRRHRMRTTMCRLERATESTLPVGRGYGLPRPVL